MPSAKRLHSAESNACRVNLFSIKAKKAELVDAKKNSSNVAASNDSIHMSKSELPSRSTHLASGVQQLVCNDEAGDNKEMTVLLFEDVDLVFEDDQGFMAAVAQVAASAKRPIILTSNDKELRLPYNLHSHLLEFNRPSPEDLTSLAYQVCIAEGVVCSPEWLQKVVMNCNYDARKMLNYLQFWCQGKFRVRPQQTELKYEVAKEGKNQIESEILSSGRLTESDSAVITYLFNLEAQHRLWPAYIDLDFPCKVTQSVSFKLNETVSEIETKHRISRERKLVQEVIKKRVLLDKVKRRMVESPPKVGFDHPHEGEEGEDITDEISTAEELCASATSLTDCKETKTMLQSSVLKRKKRRQLAIVMSESDDDTPGSSDKEQHHEDVHHSHKSLRVSREMNSINGENGFVAITSMMHADTNNDATQTLKISYSERSTSKCPLEDVGSNQIAPCSFISTIEPIDGLWSYFRTCCKNKDEFLLSPASKESFSVVSSLSDLSDNLSACDIMSHVLSGKQDVKTETSIISSQENPECCDWSLVCAQIAHESFQMCVRDSRKVAGFVHDKDVIALKDMMLAVNDPFTLGKLAADEKLNLGEFFHGQAGPLSEEQNQIRLRKKYSLQKVSTELSSMAQRSLQGAAFYEHVSFLAQMVHLEQDRLALGLTQPRARGSQSLFCSHPWNLSGNSITILLSFGIFGKQGIVGR